MRDVGACGGGRRARARPARGAVVGAGRIYCPGPGGDQVEVLELGEGRLIEGFGEGELSEGEGCFPLGCARSRPRERREAGVVGEGIIAGFE